MPLSAGDGRVRDIVREFAETGTLACDPCVSSAEPESMICQALTDEATPGVIDNDERTVVLNASDAEAMLLAAPLVKHPPVMARLSVLRDKAETWCLTDRCRAGRDDAREELERLAASAPGASAGNDGADIFAIEGGAAFVGALPDRLAQAGIGKQLGFWEWVWFSSPDTIISATTFAKDHLTSIDLKAGEKAPVATAKDAADPMRGVRGKEKDFAEATARFRPWQPYLERAFEEMGLPKELAAIAIPESEMQSGQKSGVGAGGPYQIMPANTNIPVFDVYRSKAVGIDERENPYLAARAAARIFAQARRTILGRSFVDGVSFGKELATLMCTSGYHAGAGRLGKALAAAKAEFDAEGKPVTGEALFAHILSTDKEYEKFQAASKDYPVKFLPVVKALYAEKVASFAPRGDETLPDLALVEIGAFAKKTGVADLARLTGLSREEFLKFNPQFDWKKTNDEIRLGKGGVPKCRLVLPMAIAKKLCRKLVAEKRAETKEVFSRRLLESVPGVAMRKKGPVPTALARR